MTVCVEKKNRKNKRGVVYEIWKYDFSKHFGKNKINIYEEST